MLIVSIGLNVISLICLIVLAREYRYCKIAYKSRCKANDELWDEYMKFVEEYCDRVDQIIELREENKKLKNSINKESKSYGINKNRKVNFDSYKRTAEEVIKN